MKCSKRNDVEQDYTPTLCNKNNEVNKIDEIDVKSEALWGQGKPWQSRGGSGWTKNALDGLSTSKFEVQIVSKKNIIK